MAEVELVARARRKQDAVAERQEQRVAHHLGSEGGGDGAGAGDLFRARTVEGLHDRVEQLCVGIGGVKDRADLVVYPGEDVGGKQSFEDRGAVTLDDRLDGVWIGGCSVEALQSGGRTHRKVHPFLGGVETVTHGRAPSTTSDGICEQPPRNAVVASSRRN